MEVNVLVGGTFAWPAGSRRDREAVAEYGALRLYRRAYNQNWLDKVRSALTRRSNRLLKLSTVEVNHTVRRRHYAGTKTVPIRQIRGSESRCNDFDASFRPLQNRTSERWMSVAVARQLGVELAPVNLIQVGDVYFVRDGHHRISVARAMEEEHIDAVVTVWDVTETSPAECPTAAPSLG